MRGDVDEDVQVAGGCAGIACEPPPRDPQLDAVRHARRDLDRDRAVLRDPALAPAAAAGDLRPLAAPVAPRTRRDRDELAVSAALGAAHLAPAAARRARDEFLALRPRTPACRAGHRIVDRELLPAALRDLVEGELHLDAGVATRRRPPATADRGATPEELLEQGAAEPARGPEDRFEEVPAENVFDV